MVGVVDVDLQGRSRECQCLPITLREFDLDFVLHSTRYMFRSASCNSTDAQTDDQGLEDGEACCKVPEGDEDAEAMH